MVYANIKNTNHCSTTRHLSSFTGLGQRMSYNWQAIVLKLSPKMPHMLCHRLLGLLFNYSWHGTYSPATPRLLNA